jgi:hypothetical protein
LPSFETAQSEATEGTVYGMSDWCNATDKNKLNDVY